MARASESSAKASGGMRDWYWWQESSKFQPLFAETTRASQCQTTRLIISPFRALFLETVVLHPKRSNEALNISKSPFRNRSPSRSRAMAEMSQPTIYIPPKRFYVPLPQLAVEYADLKDAIKPTANLRRWNMILKASLARHQLYRYLLEDVPAPNQDRTSVEYLNWRNDRFDIIELILASVQGIVLNMSDKGWYPSSDDPRHIYFKVFESFGFNGPEDL
ncbi:hypothetical protein QBC38DRAFT_448280 [Podospora fimiseda]|uniref:Uncharacterized protein n=1 Tax=Podospora fimiseda TaxID=252190 RepID=A0AAN6YQU7_9PEZI|nr:hypothetical protein QBC38DRAFT_448280 [Podospora fimiseda]